MFILAESRKLEVKSVTALMKVDSQSYIVIPRPSLMPRKQMFSAVSTATRSPCNNTVMASEVEENIDFCVRPIIEGVCDLPGFLQVSVESCSCRNLLSLAMVSSPPLLAIRVVCWGLLGPKIPCPKPPLHLRRSSSLPHPEQAAPGRDFGVGLS